MAHAVYAARTFMFVGPRLPQLLYEKDESSVIAEVYADDRMIAACAVTQGLVVSLAYSVAPDKTKRMR
ncbi:hypothetical protein DPMN_153884 [Dreissena polymorpha]|uniref:Uncharacterized protein n=1 Tax=Dreissena polymorpha TaxID=45954 RepID=A0A9D4J9C1_DREPO|nr:hypothetical protein DPMN_153884 [Dreissena polymorpha]